VERSSLETLTLYLRLPRKMERRCCRVLGKTRISSADIAATLTGILGKPVKAKPVPRAGSEEVFRAQGMKNPTPRIQMIEGFNEG